MYYREKFENGKWWFKNTPRQEWKEFTNGKYKAKAIELEREKVKKLMLTDVIVPKVTLVCSHQWTRYPQAGTWYNGCVKCGLVEEKTNAL